MGVVGAIELARKKSGKQAAAPWATVPRQPQLHAKAHVERQGQIARRPYVYWRAQRNGPVELHRCVLAGGLAPVDGRFCRCFLTACFFGENGSRKQQQKRHYQPIQPIHPHRAKLL